MAGLRSRIAFFLSLFLCFGMEGKAQQSKSTSVAVHIKVPHVGNIAFPQGTRFIFYVPTAAETRGNPFAFGAPPHVARASVPFIITGNSSVTFHVEPDAFLLTQNGAIRGLALATDESGAFVPYRVVLEFPIGSPARQLNGIGVGGRNVTADATLTADAGEGALSGMIDVVPDITRGDIVSGRARPGWYGGEVQVLVTTGN